MTSRFWNIGLGQCGLRSALCGILMLLVLSGCETTGGGDVKSSAAASKPAAPPKDQVLREYKAAADHMRAARFAEAKPLLDSALLTLGGISAGDKSAKQARSLFRSESSKSFRGEPYERVMAYFYRGILYWMDGEPDNARACFRSAALMDSDPEKGKYQSDYVLLD